MGMLNYETLLSSYDDKLTLMQWLKKVEAALKNASATSFVLNKKGNATISFSIVFEDGTSLESGDIVLQQGESVESAYIQNGHLHLVLTNGDDLDAGALLDGNPLTIPAVNVDFVGNVLIEGALSVDGPAVIDGTTKLNTISSDGTQITAEKPVVEAMNGYGFNDVPVSDVTKDVLYSGVCKNGNKLTFALAFNITLSASTQAVNVGEFEIPYDIGTKLVPTNIGGSDVLDAKSVAAFVSVSSKVDGFFIVTKVSNVKVRIYLNCTNLAANTQYYVRSEVTFLLSENLAA